MAFLQYGCVYVTNRKETHRKGIWRRKFVRYLNETLYVCIFLLDILTSLLQEFSYMFDIYIKDILKFRRRVRY